MAKKAAAAKGGTATMSKTAATKPAPAAVAKEKGKGGKKGC